MPEVYAGDGGSRYHVALYDRDTDSWVMACDTGRRLERADCPAGIVNVRLRCRRPGCATRWPVGGASRDLKRELRKTWRPRWPEVKKPCASCPLREGNDDELAEVLSLISTTNGAPPIKADWIPAAATKEAVDEARRRVRLDVAARGDFACHVTAYDLETGGIRPQSEFRQCAGAARFYRDAEEP